MQDKRTKMLSRLSSLLQNTAPVPVQSSALNRPRRHVHSLFSHEICVAATRIWPSTRGCVEPSKAMVSTPELGRYCRPKLELLVPFYPDGMPLPVLLVSYINGRVNFCQADTVAASNSGVIKSFKMHLQLCPNACTMVIETVLKIVMYIHIPQISLKTAYVYLYI